MKQWKRKLTHLLFVRRLLSPWFLMAYGLFWYRFSRLCRYGGIRRNAPILMICGLFFFGWLMYFLAERILYRRQSAPVIYKELWMKENRLKLPDGMELDYKEIRWYKKKGNQIWLFLAGHRFIWLSTEEFSDRNREYLELMLTQRGIFATHFWKYPIALLLVLVTAAGAIHVGISASPYNGRLSWVLEDMRHHRRAALVHDNIYRDGVDGILEDIREKVELPKELCLINSFNLHFAPDGTVESLDTFVQGYDDARGVGGTYLISYDRRKSHKIDIYVNESEGVPGFDSEKDLEPLLSALRVIPLEDTVSGWNQDVYGILYYGVRSWGYNPEGIRYINGEGVITMPGEFISDEIRGPSISVFCPENEEITPVRYLYQGVL